MGEPTLRTQFLLDNPGIIDAVALRVGVPSAELEDFRQEALLGSVRRKDEWDPEKASLKTYAIRCVTWDALLYVKKLKNENPDLANPRLGSLPAPGREDY